LDQQNSTGGAGEVKALDIPPEARTFLEGLLQDSGILNLGEEEKEEMIKELYARLDNFITSTIIDNLPPENMEEFIKMTEQNKSKSEIEAYLNSKMPNAKEVFANAFIEFRNLYLGNVTVARNAPSAGGTAENSPVNTVPVPDGNNQVN